MPTELCPPYAVDRVMMSARWILAAFAVVFGTLVAFRLLRTGGQWDPATKTWAIIAVIFGVVSAFLLD